MRLHRPIAALAMVILLAVAVESRQARGRLTIDLLLDIRHPSSPAWSPDGSHVAFVWDRGGVQNVWVVGTPAPSADSAATSVAEPRNLTRADAGQVQTLWWSQDGRSVLFARDGTLWRAVADGSSPPQRVWAQGDGGGFAPGPDGDQIAFSRAGDLWIRSLTTGAERQVTTTGTSESGPVWSPDGKRLAFAISSGKRRSYAPDFHGGKLLFAWTEREVLPDVGIVPIAGGPVVMAAATPGSESSPAWIDGETLVIQRIDEGYKAREIVAVNASTGVGRVLDREVDAKWFGLTYNNAAPLPSPDGRRVAFLSDRDGRDHLYVAATAGGRVSQLTRGDYDVARLAWSPDSARIAFDSNEAGPPGRMQIAAVDVSADGSPGRVVRVTSGHGAAVEPVWAPAGNRLVYTHTDARNSADLFVAAFNPAGSPTSPARLTDSMPAAVDRAQLTGPQLVYYPSADGKQVPASLFVPEGLDRARKHPAIVWIHGDLVTQNYEGWHIRRDYGVYYSFHQYLLQRGYVVLAPDYRGSIGYGKAWRQDVYRDLGGKEYRDVIAGVDYLKSLGFVDMDRIGVWGLSYGGFLTLQAVTMNPTLFTCAIDVAGVTDYGEYLRDPNQPWLTARMGTREDNPDQYDQAAPIRRASRIVRPLLVLGGTADTNVPYEQTARLVDELLKAGKDFEFMMYPGELHYFHRAHVLRDAWTRVERFFEQHLHPESTSGR